MGIKDVLNKFRRTDETFDQLKEQDRAMTKLQERKLSANERALNRILKQKHEEAVKAQLDKYTKQEQREFWHKDVITQPEILKNHKSILDQRHLFANQPNPFTESGRSRF